MTEDEQLLADYNEEVSQSEKWTVNFTMETLIRQSREYRKQNKEDGEKYRSGFKEGYENGYKMGASNAAKDTIMLEDLRKMTFQELANLIGDENDY